MEFIIVMPIYFLLLGFAFVVGELSLHSIHLSASGDRNVAFATKLDAEFWKEIKQVLSLDRNAVANRTEDAPDYSYEGDEAYQGRAAVSEFSEGDEKVHKSVLPKENGHWTEAVAGRAVDNYTLSPITRGIVAHWFYETEKRVYDDNLMAEKLTRPEKDDIDVILDKDNGSLGRVAVKGNYYEDDEGDVVRYYGHFSLRRTEKGRWHEGAAVKPYRYWASGALAIDDNWKMAATKNVDDGDYPYHEQTASVKCDELFYVLEGSDGSKLEKATMAEPTPESVDYEFSDKL